MMCLKSVLLFLLLNISILKGDEQNVQHLNRFGNLTLKYGNRSEIHFEIKEPNKKYMESQFAELHAKLDKIFEKLSQLSEDQMSKKNTDLTLASSQFPSSCAEATALSRRSGAYLLQLPSYSPVPFIASCDEHTQGGGWTVVLRRQDGSVNFFLYWKDYKQGIGNVNGEYFIGLEKLYALTKDQDQELLVTMKNSEGVQKYALYDNFFIDDEKSNYKLSSLGVCTGDAGDSLIGHLGMPFSSRDRDNDNGAAHCARTYTGAWWYTQCHSSNLMGVYNDSTYGKGINWYSFTGHNSSLSRVEMLIRKRRT
ncbi:ficolin-2-like [Drosophila busckii]|uniref:ficolin-2-like n=1 Tax=Drosophila busckii TaxID=30019 RepID=UPI00083F2189|nr:ficolin-2-like [Drosophila busckii]